jgi:hypothetical protein
MRPEELHPLQTRDAATESDLAGLIDREFAVIGNLKAVHAKTHPAGRLRSERVA